VIATEIRSYAAEQCRRESNALSPAFFEEHILPVADYGVRLARQLGADPEIVEISAYLHDISAVVDLRSMPEHPRLSAEASGSLLAQMAYPSDSIRKVERCILTHSSPLQIGEGSLEEVCLSNADAVSQIARLPYWLFFAFSIRRLGFCEGTEWLRNRVETNWRALIEPARALVEREYALARDCLK